MGSLSYLLNSGVPAIVIMKIAGHASLEQINKTYGHAWDSEKVEAAEKFEELFKKGSPNNAPQGLHTIFTPIGTCDPYDVLNGTF